MDRATRKLLEENQAMREKRVSAQLPRRLVDGEVEMRIPEKHVPMLRLVLPELWSPNEEERNIAWEGLKRSELGAQYMVTPTPSQVQRTKTRGVIIK